MKVTAYAPASIGNVSVGFDLLGAAMQPIDGSLLGDTVSIEASSQPLFSATGRFAHKLPAEANKNIVLRCAQVFHQRLQELGQTPQTLAIHLAKNLPIGSGLGSSASSIVAALFALNEFYQQPFSDNDLLFLMGECEGEISGAVHYDNVAPAHLGGMTLMTGQTQPICLPVPAPAQWYYVLAYSGISVSTAAARELMPKQVEMSTCIQFAQNLANFIHACHTNNSDLIKNTFVDVVAEPYRKVLLPGFDAAREFASQEDVIGFGISGSGPTVFAVTDDLASAERIASYLQAHYLQNEDGFTHVCQLDTQGARCLTI